MKYIRRITAVVIAASAFCVSVVSAQSISANTTLSIFIKGVPTQEQGAVGGQYVVDSSGFVHLPHLKAGLKASGLTSSSLARKIEGAYKSAEIYNNPRITVISSKDKAAQSIDTKLVSIGGFVKRPGPIPYTRDMTLFQALSAAGGESPFGSIKRVELHRNGKVWKYDLRNSTHMRVKVFPGDSIKIPQKTAFGN